MEEIEFIFQTSEPDKQALMPQVSKALKKRLEINSQQIMRKKNAQQTVPMTEEEKKRQKRKKILQGILLMVAGVIAFAAGLMGAERNTWLIVVGAIAVVLGFFNLRTTAAVTSNPDKFDKAAEEFLDSHEENIRGKKVQVCFSGEELITARGELDELDQEVVPFDEIEMVLETKDIFLMIHNRQGVLLQKKDLDLDLGSVEEFREFVSENIKPVISLMDEEPV